MHRAMKLACISYALVLSIGRPLSADPSEAPAPPSPAKDLDIDVLAREAQTIIDAVLEHHLDPPTRQELWLAGTKALLARAGVSHRGGLSAEISQLTTFGELAGHLAEICGHDGFPNSRDWGPALQHAFIDGVLQAVPGGASLIPPKELLVQEQLQGNRYIGTGIALSYEPEKKYSQIGAVIAGGPMERAGGRVGDLILKIDDRDVKGVSLGEMIDLLRGAEGTSVTLVVGPSADESRTIVVTRGPVVLETLAGLRKSSDRQWDYRIEPWLPVYCVKVRQINGSTVHDLRKLERQFQADGVQAVILDLRSNSADDLHHTLLLADALMDGGVIGRVRTGRDVHEIRADRECLFRDWPLAVLVDHETRGGGEWIAAALQDNHEAVVVGETTAGFAFVRTSVPLAGSDGALHLNTGIFERPSGLPLQKIENPNALWTSFGEESQAAWGVTPDLPKPSLRRPESEGPINPRRRRPATEGPLTGADDPDYLGMAVRELRMRIDAGEGRHRL